jgi:UDP-N-acetyl-2-amino-2-deoxyglucuronate dehydrogenase
MSTAPDIGFGIIGSGMVASVHAAAIRAMRGGHLACVFNPNAASAARLGAAQGVPAYSDWDSFLAHPGLQAVTIATPSGSHHACTLRAAAAGKHVVCEKPLEVTLEKIDAMIRACAENGVLLAAIHQRRFLDSTRMFKRAVDAGRFGRITLADAYIKWFRTQQYYDQVKWRGTWQLDGGGALMNQSIHTIDQLIHLVGDVTSVCAFAERAAHERIEVEDVATAVLRFANGALGVIEGSTACYSKLGHGAEVQVCGTEGSVFMRDESFTAWDFQQERPEDAAILAQFGARAGTAGVGAADPKAITFVGHQRVFEDMAQAIALQRLPAVTGAEARKSVEIILAIYQSALAGGMPVNLPLARTPELRPFDQVEKKA